MAAKANIVLADAQGTPVNHTFVPSGFKDGVDVWEEKNVDASVGNLRITASLANPTQGGSDYKAVIKFWNPQLEVTAPSTATGYQPAPKVAYNCIAELRVNLPARSSLQKRKDTSKMMGNLILSSAMQDLLNDLVPPA